MSDTQKRKHERFTLPRTLAKLSLIKDRLEFEVEVVNISHSGLAILTQEAITKGSQVCVEIAENTSICLLYTSPSPRDGLLSRMPSSA